jgi:hypothetical protein
MPSYSTSEPTTNDTVAIPVHTRGTPVCTSIAKPNMASSSRPTPTGVVGRTASP